LTGSEMAAPLDIRFRSTIKIRSPRRLSSVKRQRARSSRRPVWRRPTCGGASARTTRRAIRAPGRRHGASALNDAAAHCIATSA
jgi:hypothetical protein